MKTLLRGKETVNYKHHIGGSYYVSVKSGFSCVDFRKFYKTYHDNGGDDNEEKSIKPTKIGISLNMDEWANLWALIDTINGDYPSLADAQPCYYDEDHMGEMGCLQCTECYPFSNSSLAKLMSA